MKKLFFALLALPLLVACNQDIKDENARLKLENEQLSNNVNSQDSVINSFIDDFAQIQDNLSAIREREESIQAASEGDMEKSDKVRESVINDVEVINQLLSEKRAKRCYDYLTENGIDRSRMTHAGYGETRPMSTNSTATGRKTNRRVTFDLFSK